MTEPKQQFRITLVSMALEPFSPPRAAMAYRCAFRCRKGIQEFDVVVWMDQEKTRLVDLIPGAMEKLHRDLQELAALTAPKAEEPPAGTTPDPA